MEGEAWDEDSSPTCFEEGEEPKVEKAELDALERVVGDATAEAMPLTLALLKHITNGFSYKTEIGRGGFAIVYLGTLPNGSRIAVKRITNNYRIDGRAFYDEVDITMKAAHKYTVRLIGHCCDTRMVPVQHEGRTIFAEEKERLLCMEYVRNGTLDIYITDKFPGRLDWNQHYQILKGVSQALSYLHDEVRVIHGDINPKNVLLDGNFMPKLFDFGISMCLPEGEDAIATKNIVGTFGYIAPELISDWRYSVKADIYGFGVLIVELLTGHRGYQGSVGQVLKKLRKTLVHRGAFSSWEDKYQQVRTCLEIGYNCIDDDPDIRPTAMEIIHRLELTESTDNSVSSGHALLLWQSLDEEYDLSDSDTDTVESEQDQPQPIVEIPPSNEELADLDTNGETSTQEHDKPETLSKLPGSADLSKLEVLENITEDFSHTRIVGKDGTFRGSHKAFVYKGDISYQTMVAVKRLIGVEIPADKFKREAEQFMRLDHKNIVKVAGYCHDESRGHKLVQFKGKPLPQVFNGPEQLLCYDYVNNGSLREYLAGQGSHGIDWNMRYKLIKGICEGLHYLHKGRGDCPIVHLNLSPSNVLLDENNVPRITGFDFSKLIGEKNTKSVVLKLNGPIAYLPPDFFHSKGTDLKYLATVDIYSLGLMILEITTRQEIKAGGHGMLIKNIEEKWREDSQIASLYTSLEPDKLWQVKLCIDIGLDCMKSKPEKRPTAGALMLWLDKGSKPVPVPRAGAGVPRPTVRTNITQADNHIKEKEKSMGFMKRFGWK